MLLASKCVDICPENTLNLMNRQCISKDSCEKENSIQKEKLNIVSSNGTCKQIRHCESIKINEKSGFSQLSGFQGCQVVQGYVDIQFSRSVCKDSHGIRLAIKILSEIEEIRDYLKITNSPSIKNLEFLPKLKMIRGVTLESGVNSIVLDSNKQLKSLKDTSRNYRFYREAFCKENCVSKSNNLALDVTATTYGLLVKITNKRVKNLMDQYADRTLYVKKQDAFHFEHICFSEKTYSR